MMSLYPDLPGPMAKAIAHDAIVIALLIVFVWLGFRVYHDVDKLSSLGRGLVETGHSIKSGFSAAASALGSVRSLAGHSPARCTMRPRRRVKPQYRSGAAVNKTRITSRFFLAC